ncbi:MAG TPA: GntR family transcriptional regulator [Streptosporangiaceae bacterium]|nr:GntR family transcriptional regulator [Streptosporangiaceae bacterium]
MQAEHDAPDALGALDAGPQVRSRRPQVRSLGQQARRSRLPSGSLARILPGSLARMPPQLVRGLGQTVHAQIEDWLAGAIAAGQLAPGDRLPAEHDLAAWLGVSRMTLRHALSELAQRGLVIRAVGRHGGTFVAEPKLDQDVTTLAGFSEQLRRHGMVAGARVLAAAQIQAGPAAAAALDLSVGDPVHEVRRIRLADGHPMVLEHSQFPAALFPGLIQCRLDGSLYELAETKFGQRPHRAKETFEPVIAGVREAEALEVDEGAPLMLVERTAYSRSGLPLEFARDLFRGDRTRVVIWTSELVGEL